MIIHLFYWFTFLKYIQVHTIVVINMIDCIKLAFLSTYVIQHSNDLNFCITTFTTGLQLVNCGSILEPNLIFNVIAVIFSYATTSVPLQLNEDVFTVNYARHSNNSSSPHFSAYFDSFTRRFLMQSNFRIENKTITQLAIMLRYQVMHLVLCCVQYILG